jgi:site-specific recombinase XerC
VSASCHFGALLCWKQLPGLCRTPESSQCTRRRKMKVSRGFVPVSVNRSNFQQQISDAQWIANQLTPDLEVGADVVDALDGYHNWLRNQSLAANTCRVYLSQVRCFLRAMQISGRIADSSSGYASLIIQHITENQKRDDVSQRSIRVLRAALESYANFLGIELPDLNSEVARQLKAVPCKPAEIDTLAAEDLITFRQVVSSLSCVRDKCIALLLLNTGLTPEQCSLLNLSNLRESSTRGICLLLDTKDLRMVPVHGETAECLAQLYGTRSKQAAFRDGQPLFISKGGRRLSAGTIHYIVRGIGHKARVSVSPKQLRRAFVVSILAESRHLLLLMRAAGLNSIDAALKYIR